MSPFPGALQRRYAHGAGVDEPLVWYEGSSLSGPRWLISDRQGSVIAATNSAGAPIGAVYRYGPYGEPDDTNGWGGSRFRYTGQIALPEVGLYHYKARVYDPYAGRFLQTDPIGYEDDLNLYAYVRNDPLNANDPTGMECVTERGGPKCTLDQVEIDGRMVDLTDELRTEISETNSELASEIARIETATTNAYAAALRAGEREVALVGRDGVPTRRVSGNQVAAALQGKQLRYNPSNSAIGPGGMQSDLRLGTITIGDVGRSLNPFQNWFVRPTAISVAFIHEGIHFTRAATGWHNWMSRNPGLGLLHQTHFDSAAQRLFSMGRR